MPDCMTDTPDQSENQSELRYLAVYLAQRVDSYARKRIENWVNEKQVRVPLDARSVESLLQGIYDYGVMRGEDERRGLDFHRQKDVA